jgi:hypothetical protein
MNDPHVESLTYKFEAEEGTSYQGAETREWDLPDFHLRLSEELLTVTMKQHFPSEEDARKAVKRFLEEMGDLCRPARHTRLQVQVCQGECG